VRLAPIKQRPKKRGETYKERVSLLLSTSETSQFPTEEIKQQLPSSHHQSAPKTPQMNVRTIMVRKTPAGREQTEKECYPIESD
jgi:hypothetical protein